MMRLMSWAIATVFGVGHAPIAPGTFGSLAGVLLWYAVSLSTPQQWVVGLAISLIGTWAAGDVARRAGESDPGRVVVDEVAGMWLTLAGLPKTLPIAIAGFVVFRALDIIKPPPIRQLERLPEGVGIMADDLAAGLAGRVILAIALRLLQR